MSDTSTLYPNYFNDTHEQVRDTIRKFVAGHIDGHMRDWEEAGSFPRELYTLAGDAVILSLGYPEELGVFG